MIALTTKFIQLPTNILADILCYTNDKTIYSLACTCKTLSNLLNTNKNEITWSKYKCQSYDFYAHMPTRCLFANAHAGLEVEKSWIETHELSMYIFTMMLLHKVDGVNDYDAISSIQVKGDVRLLTITIGQDVHLLLNVSEYLRNNILKQDTDGYTEVLTPFLDIIPTYCSNTTHSFMSVQSNGGDVAIKITKAKLREKPLQYSLRYRTPSTFFFKSYEECLPNKIVIPISCTWDNAFACIICSRRMDDLLQRIELSDAKSNFVYCIAAERLEATFVNKLFPSYQWLDFKCPHTTYLIPLFGCGGMYNIVMTLKKTNHQQPTTNNNLQVYGIRWQEACVVYPTNSA